MSLFNNIRKPWAAWEMTMEAHDPVNNRTLDLSGNNRHLTLGNGAGVSVPAKNSRIRGYTNTASNYMGYVGYPWSSNTITVEIMLQLYNLVGGAAPYIGQMFDALGLQFVVIWAPSGLSGTYRFYTGGLSANNASLYTMPKSTAGVIHLIGRYNGTETHTFIDTKKALNAVTPLAPVATLTSNIRFFQLYTGGASTFRGSLYFARIWDIALSDVEIQELYRKAREELHRI